MQVTRIERRGATKLTGVRSMIALATGLAAFVVCAASSRAAVEPAAVKFNRDVRPILSENCFACHGPDKNKRKADLRLDTKEGLFGKARERHAGRPRRAWQERADPSRITSSDPDEMMPPAKSKKPRLTAEQVDVLKRWVEQGAEWEPHWSFVPPQRPAAAGR